MGLSLGFSSAISLHDFTSASCSFHRLSFTSAICSFTLWVLPLQFILSSWVELDLYILFIYISSCKVSLCIFLSRLPHDFSQCESLRFSKSLTSQFFLVWVSAFLCVLGSIPGVTVRLLFKCGLWITQHDSQKVSVWLNYSSLCFWLKPLFLLTKSLKSLSVCFNPLSRYVYGLPYLTYPFGDKIKLWIIWV